MDTVIMKIMVSILFILFICSVKDFFKSSELLKIVILGPFIYFEILQLF